MKTCLKIGGHNVGQTDPHWWTGGRGLLNRSKMRFWHAGLSTPISSHSEDARNWRPYNNQTMRRRFIAIFSLLFIVSVGLFAFGQVEGIASSLAEPNAITSSLGGSSDQDVDLSEHGHDQGLADNQAELPEQMLFRATQIASAHRVPSPAALTPPAETNPALDGLRRPPRA